jgi:hypothetical protein
MKSYQLIALLTAMVVLLAQVELAFGEGAPSGKFQNNPTVHLIVSLKPTEEDKNWRITKMETSQHEDPLTGLIVYETIVFREGPPGYRSNFVDPYCEPTSTDEMSITAASCSYWYPDSRTSIVTIGAVTGTLKHYTYRYCISGGSCNMWRPYRLEVWWERTSSSWSVQSAVTSWGCNLCATCPGNTWSGGYTDGPFMPAWYGNRTGTYIYTANWPELEPLSGAGGFIKGWNDSQVVSHSGNTPMALHTAYP